MPRFYQKPGIWIKVLKKDGVKGLIKHFFTLPRIIIPTKSGWVFFLFMLIIVVFAYITSNNLLFLLFASMLSMMVASGLLSESSLGKVSVRRTFPGHIFARRPFTLQYHFTNHSKFLGAYAFSLSDDTLFEEDNSPFVPHLKAQENLFQKQSCLIKSRGYIKLPDYKITTQYPFLLFVKSKKILSKEELLVFPAIHPVPLIKEKLLSGSREGQKQKQGEGDSVSYLREYTEGEPISKVDWKKSAKLDEIYIKEFDQLATKKVAVVFNPDNNPDYEHGLEISASFLVQLYNYGIPFTLVAGEDEQTSFSTSKSNLLRSLKTLALYEKPQRPKIPTSVDSIIEVKANGEYSFK